ncbi:abortive infection family protein [Sporosarcina sp. FSL K6-1508]|uniref:abortive infection family protein n=1 Tax=Sporosarcina sp. FSL K6-1508 TaxID=2921553 RepID=UPI0030F93412
MEKLGNKEIISVVAYIGGEGGYLGNFSYATHASFYPEYCGLDIDPYKYEGTTRNRFITILTNATRIEQYKILEGVLEKYPLSNVEELFHEDIINEKQFKSKQNLFEKISIWTTLLQGDGLILIENIKHDSKFVKEVLNQCETLISNHKYSSGVDRAHTALHAFIKELCEEEGLTFQQSKPKLQEYWSKLRTEHSKFKANPSNFLSPVNQIVNAIAKVIENINEIRNDGAYTHPNEEIIDEAESKLVINLSRVFLQYIDDRINP